MALWNAICHVPWLGSTPHKNLRTRAVGLHILLAFQWLNPEVTGQGKTNSKPWINMDKHRVYGCICFNIQGWRFQVNHPTSSQLLPSHDDVSIRSQPILHDRCVHSDEGVEVTVFKEWQGGPGGLLTARVSRFGCKSRSSRGKSWQSFSNELLFDGGRDGRHQVAPR